MILSSSFASRGAPPNSSNISTAFAALAAANYLRTKKEKMGHLLETV